MSTTSPRDQHSITVSLNTLNQVFEDSEDFTVFLSKAEAENLGILDSSHYSAEQQLLLQPSSNAMPIVGRALACRCYGGKLVSVTVRPEKRINAHGAWKMSSNNMTAIVEQLKKSAYRPDQPSAKGKVVKPTTNGPMHRHVSVYDLCDCLWDLVFRERSGGLLSGLVVVAGRTGSAKSHTARGLIYKLLTNEAVIKTWAVAKGKRRPHLITLEDPIEKPLYKVCTLTKTVQETLQIDYTPRDKIRGDFETLPEALSDALRQTPTVVYVGEVRSTSDWNAVIEFAGTGHLIITTTHAGSVTETLAKIFDSNKAHDPESLGRIAQRILAVIHQSPLELTEHKSSALIPTVWRNTPAGIAGLISEGLSSVLPHFPLDGKEQEKSSLGRRWFVKKLLACEDPELGWQFDALALQRDLKGM